MEITEVRVSLRNEERLKAYVTVTFDSCFVVRHIRIVHTEKGIIVSMPSRKLPDGTHKDIAHPISQDFRKKLESKVLQAFEEEKLKQPPAFSRPAPNAAPIAPPQQQPTQQPPTPLGETNS